MSGLTYAEATCNMLRQSSLARCIVQVYHALCAGQIAHLSLPKTMYIGKTPPQLVLVFPAQYHGEHTFTFNEQFRWAPGARSFSWCEDVFSENELPTGCAGTGAFDVSFEDDKPEEPYSYIDPGKALLFLTREHVILKDLTDSNKDGRRVFQELCLCSQVDEIVSFAE